jgi:hypothetical protein
LNFRQAEVCCATIELVKEAPHQTIRRRLDEPRLEIGDRVLIKDGMNGVVLARYTPSGGRNQVCYIVEVISAEDEKESLRSQKQPPAKN